MTKESRYFAVRTNLQSNVRSAVRHHSTWRLARITFAHFETTSSHFDRGSRHAVCGKRFCCLARYAGCRQQHPGFQPVGIAGASGGWTAQNARTVRKGKVDAHARPNESAECKR